MGERCLSCGLKGCSCSVEGSSRRNPSKQWSRRCAGGANTFVAADRAAHSQHLQRILLLQRILQQLHTFGISQQPLPTPRW